MNATPNNVMGKREKAGSDQDSKGMPKLIIAFGQQDLQKKSREIYIEGKG